MANDDCIRFTLSDDTRVIVKKVLNNKYDFELTLPNGNRKSFMWLTDGINEFGNRKEASDKLIDEAVAMFVATRNG